MNIAQHLELKARIERGESRFSVLERADKGSTVSQTLCYRAETVEGECGVTFFEADSYEARLYNYEGNMRGIVSSPPLYGKGSRWHVVFSWATFSSLRLAAKYAVTLRERSPLARELAIQAEVRF
jgi:hypothetical protein